jgi:hypothetical protein
MEVYNTSYQETRSQMSGSPASCHQHPEQHIPETSTDANTTQIDINATRRCFHRWL